MNLDTLIEILLLIQKQGYGDVAVRIFKELDIEKIELKESGDYPGHTIVNITPHMLKS